MTDTMTLEQIHDRLEEISNEIWDIAPFASFKLLKLCDVITAVQARAAGGMLSAMQSEDGA